MNRLSKILILLVLGCLQFGSILGQKVASPAGDQYKNQYCQVDWTLGECATQTYYSGPFILTEGFHQPALLITKINAEHADSGIKVYPNPTSDKFVISFSDVPPAKTVARLYDGMGQLISAEDLTSSESVYSMESLPVGFYSLTITVSNKEEHQFKIIKSVK